MKIIRFGLEDHGLRLNAALRRRLGFSPATENVLNEEPDNDGS
jgi:hypothetical protein